MEGFDFDSIFSEHVLFLALVAVFVCSLDQFFLESVINVRIFATQAFDLLVLAMTLAHDFHLIDVLAVACLYLLMVKSITFLLGDLLLTLNRSLQSI